MIIDSYIGSIIDNLFAFYNNLNVLGLTLFYSFIILLIVLIILLGIIERNRHFEIKHNTKSILPVVVNTKKDNIEVIGMDDNKYRDIVEDVANRNIVNINSIAKKMEEDLGGNKNINLTDFEEEQEAKSIISYEELLDKTARFKADDIKKEFNNSMQRDLNNVNNEDKKFANTPLISPVYGVKQDQYNNQENNKVERTLNINSINNEINKNDDFLKALKDLKNKLD